MCFRQRDSIRKDLVVSRAEHSMLQELNKDQRLEARKEEERVEGKKDRQLGDAVVSRVEFMTECQGIGKYPQFPMVSVYFHLFLGTEFIVFISEVSLLRVRDRKRGRERREREEGEEKERKE